VPGTYASPKNHGFDLAVASEEGLALATELEEYAKKQRAEGRRPRGFEIVKDRDGTGGMTDCHWRGGRWS
jgi:hypothetical protein